MKKILIIGATSAIAEHCARLWAARGDMLYLVARNQEKLETIQKDLTVRGAARVATYGMNVNDYDSHTKMLDEAEKSLDGFDTILIAHGILSNQKACEHDIEMTMQEINTNALSTISLLTHIANHFETKKSGTIAVISSVAGDRGRASNYVYGSAKAMVTAFTSGLRQRLYKSNVAVITIKPGLIDTPMTSNFKKGLLWSSPEKIATKIVNAIERKKSEVYLPAFWQWIMFFVKRIPHSIFNKINL